MGRYNVPRIIFINKLDRAGANPWAAIEQIRNRLDLNVAAIQVKKWSKVRSLWALKQLSEE